MSPGHLQQIGRALSPVRPWFQNVRLAGVPVDLAAGFTNAAVVLPQGMAFAVIAGLPPQYGLYAAMITPVIAAFWGASTIMVSGPTTAISVLFFASLSELEAPGSEAYIQLALVLTLMIGAIQIAAGIVRLGALISFISHAVLVGFTMAAAVLIAVSQLGGLTGIEVSGDGPVYQRVVDVFSQTADFSSYSVVLAAVTFFCIIAIHAVSARLPGYLVALAVAAGLSIALNAPANGVSTVGALPAQLPAFLFPAVDTQSISALLPIAFTIAFVGLLEAISIGRTFAVRRREEYDANQEIVGQGLSNLVGSLFQAYAGSGSFTRSALNVSSGAKTQLAAISSSVFLLAIALLVAPVIEHVPVPAIAAVIVHVAWRLVRVGDIRRIVQASNHDTVTMLVTFVAGLTTKLDFAIAAGVITSLAFFLRQSALPMVGSMVPATFRGVRNLRNTDLYGLQECPQICIVKIEGPIFFASVDYIRARISAIRHKFAERKFVVFSLRSIGNLDLSGADFLLAQVADARRAGGDVRFVATYRPTLDALKRTGVSEALGAANLHPSKSEAITAAVAQADPSVCANCKARIYFECAGKLAPAGAAAAGSANRIEKVLGFEESRVSHEPSLEVR